MFRHLTTSFDGLSQNDIGLVNILIYTAIGLPIVCAHITNRKFTFVYNYWLSLFYNSPHNYVTNQENTSV